MGTFLGFDGVSYTSHLTKVQVPFSTPSAKLPLAQNSPNATVP
jgi:hypothetical protein